MTSLSALVSFMIYNYRPMFNQRCWWIMNCPDINFIFQPEYQMLRLCWTRLYLTQVHMKWTKTSTVLELDMNLGSSATHPHSLKFPGTMETWYVRNSYKTEHIMFTFAIEYVWSIPSLDSHTHCLTSTLLFLKAWCFQRLWFVATFSRKILVWSPGLSPQLHLWKPFDVR